MSLTVVAIQPTSAIYREEQRFGWWVYALLLMIMTLAWSAFQGFGPIHPPVFVRHPRMFVVGVTTGLVFPVGFVVGVLRMTTLVMLTDVRVWFGFIPTYRRVIPIASITRVEIVQYRPILDYWGWGISQGKDNERVLSARGNRGVRLYLFDGSRILIGSQRSEELALAVEGSLRPGH